MSPFAERRYRDILAHVSYRDWIFDVVRIGGAAIALRVSFTDSETGEEWTGRKWYLSPHMTDSEVIQTALLAVLQAEEHEARERFRVDGQAIYGPHLNAWDLVEVLKARGDGALDTRGES